MPHFSPEFKTPSDIKITIEKELIHQIKIGVTDFNGILRGKYISSTKFLAGLDSGLGFCDVILGCDVNDQLISGLQYTGWHTGYPDAPLKIIPSTGRRIPDEPNTLFFLCEFDGQTESLCPRSILRKTIQKAQNMGFYPDAAFEYEFSVFNETIESIRTKSYQNLTPLSPDNFGYSLIRSTMFSKLYHNIIQECLHMGITLEGLHTEIGAGILEAAITYGDALTAADNAVVFKNLVKQIAHKHNLVASFMAKCSETQQGQSGHIHLSLKNNKGRNLFYDADAKNNMSPIMQQFLAGQVKYMPELLALVAPTVNDYARLVPDFWAPTEANWSFDNRTTALRVIQGSEKAQRIEYRIASASSNPYLALTAALMSGLAGIEEALTLNKPLTNHASKLPSTLLEAASRLRKSHLANAVLDACFIHDYAATREHEEHLYRKQVTDWQLNRYFEII